MNISEYLMTILPHNSVEINLISFFLSYIHPIFMPTFPSFQNVLFWHVSNLTAPQ